MLGLSGLILTTGLIAYQGFGVVFAALAVAGWGLLAVVLFHLIPMFFDALGWFVLLRKTMRPRLRVFLWIRWIREAVNGLLPVAQVGGELVGTRLLMLNGVPGAIAGGSVVVDLTLAVLTLLIFVLIGLGVLLLIADDWGLVLGVLMGVGIAALGALGFILVQRRGLFQTLIGWLSSFTEGQQWLAVIGRAARLDEAIHALYREKARLAACAGSQLTAWLLGAGEVWLALYFLGHPVTIMEALLLESLGQAVRNAAFTVPGGLGVQEGGYMILGGVLGLSPETGLALSLAKRVRELTLGLPGLMSWQWIEGRRLFACRATSSTPVDPS